MANQRQIDIYSAGCAVCEDAVKMVRDMACPSCNITVRDMTDPEVSSKAKGLGIKTVPAIVIDDQLADCCSAAGISADTLRAAGVGSPLS